MYVVKPSLKKSLITSLFIFTTLHTTSQIVNIETARLHSDTTGLLGDLGAAFSFTKNTATVLQADIDAHLQYKTKKDIYLLLGSYGILKSGGTSLIDNSFFHLRYNRKLIAWLRWELFTQFQNNGIAKIKTRYLFGTGPRFKILSHKNLKLYVGSLIMYEVEKEEIDPPVINKEIRNSSYVSFSFTPSALLEIVTTTFYQPLIKNLTDYRILNQTSFKVKGGNHFSLSLQGYFSFDSKPVIGIPNENYNLSTRLGYDF